MSRPCENGFTDAFCAEFRQEHVMIPSGPEAHDLHLQEGIRLGVLVGMTFFDGM